MSRDIYLDGESFRRKSAELVERAVEFGRSAFTPGRTALIVLDMQRYFLDPDSHAHIPSAVDIIPGLRSLATVFSESGLPVVFTRHLNTAQNGGALALWWDDLIREEDPLSEITADLDTSMGIVLKKSQYDAFYDTDLENSLKQRGIERVVVSGVMTHLCCETTARSAFVRGFEVTFPVDGTATYDEEFHLATLLNLSHGFATLAFVENVVTAVEGAKTHSGGSLRSGRKTARQQDCARGDG
jgi:isochorismate hydrolase